MRQVFKNNIRITIAAVIAVIVFICIYMWFVFNGYLYNDVCAESNTYQTQQQQETD